MVSLTVIFYMFLILFAVIGAMRGWAKEILVTFSVILSLFMINVLERFVPPVAAIFASAGPPTAFWVRAIIVILLSFFGYQTPNIRSLAGARFARERIQDVLLGFILGGFNGYLVIGTLWYYLAITGYPFEVITPPQQGQPFFQASQQLLTLLPPVWLDDPTIYIAVAIAFLFVIVVFI